jgi:hypothetical protein
MTSEPFGATGVTQDSICVLHAADSGEIVFVHRVTTLGEVPAMSDDELETDARKSMRLTMHQLGVQPPENLAMIVVTPDEFQPGQSYVVDYSTGTLVERRDDTSP